MALFNSKNNTDPQRLIRETQRKMAGAGVEANNNLNYSVTGDNYKSTSELYNEQKAKEDKNFLQKTATAVGSSIAQAPTSAMGLSLNVLDALTNDASKVGGWVRKAQTINQGVNDAINNNYNLVKENSNFLEKTWLDITRTGTDVLVDGLIGLITPGANLASMAVRSAGQGSMQAQASGLDDWKALVSGAKTAGIELLTEKIGGVGGRKLYGYSDDIVQEIPGWLDGAFDRLTTRVSQSSGSETLGKLTTAFLSEASEEMLSDILNPLADRILALDDGTGNWWQNISLGDVLYDGLLGGIVGMGGVATRALTPGADAKMVSRDMMNRSIASQIVTNPKLREAFEQKIGERLPEAKETAINVVKTFLDRLGAVTSTAAQPAQTQQNSEQTAENISAPPAPETQPTGESERLNSVSANTGIDPVELLTGIPAENKKTAPIKADKSTYYAVEAAPDSKAKVLAVESAFIGSQKNKESTGAVLNMGNPPQVTSEAPQRANALNEANASTNNIRQTGENSNSEFVERGFSENVRTDAGTNDRLRKDLEENALLYKRLSNKDTLAAARGIFDRGYENAARTLQEAIGAAKAGGKLSPEMVPLSRMVANEMAHRGDVQGARQVIADVAAELTAAGELGQAGAILRDPLSALRTVETVLKDINTKISARIRPGTVVIAKDRGNFGKVVSEKNGIYRIKFTSRDGAERILDLNRDAFYVAESKKTGKGAQNAATSQNGNIYVTGWAEQIGRNLADKLTVVRGTKDLSITQKVENDISSMIKRLSGGSLSVGPVAATVDPKIAKIEQLADTVNNAEFYNKALEEARVLLADKYGVPRADLENILGEWANYSIEQITINEINKALEKELGENASRGSWVARLTPEEEQLILNTDFTKDGAFEKVYSQIAQRLGTEMPSTLWEKVTELRRINMLLRPRTLIKNTVGNIPMVGLRKASERLSGAIQDAWVKSGKLTAEEQTRTASVTQESRALAKEVYPQFEAVLNGQSDKWDLTGVLRENRTIFKTGALEQVIGKIADKDIETAFLESARRFTYDCLQKGDSPFVKSAFVDSLAQYCSAHNITDADSIPQAAIDFATANAMEATFKATSSVAKLLNQLKSNGGLSGAALDVLFPFTTTPINITTQMLKYSPAEFVNTVRLVVNSANSADIADSVSKASTGTAVMALGFLLRAIGAVSAGEDEDKDKAAYDKSKGVGVYSFRFGDSSISYDWAQPAGSLLALGAEIADGLSDDASFWTTVMNSIYTAGDSVLNMSLFQNVLQVLKGTGTPTQQVIDSILEGGATQFVPGLLGDIAKIVDGTVRSSYTGGNVLDNSKAKITSNVPGLSMTLPASVNTRGEEISRGSLGARTINQLVNPGTVTSGKTDAATKAIDELYEATGNKTIFPQVAPYKVDYGTGYTMTGEERAQFQTTQGQTYYNSLNRLIESGQWEKMSEDAQIKTLQQINEFAKDSAKRELVTGRGDKYSSDWNDEATLALPSEYIAAKAVFSTATSDKNARDYDAIDDLIADWDDLRVSTKRQLTSTTGVLDDLVAARKAGVSSEAWYTAKDAIDDYKESNNNSISGVAALRVILGEDFSPREEAYLVSDLSNSKEVERTYNAFTNAGYAGSDAFNFLLADGGNSDGTMNKQEEKKYIKNRYGADFDEIWAILYPNG